MCAVPTLLWRFFDATSVRLSTKGLNVPRHDNDMYMHDDGDGDDDGDDSDDGDVMMAMVMMMMIW